MNKKTKWNDVLCYNGLTRKEVIEERYDIKYQSAVESAKRFNFSVFHVYAKGFSSMPESIDIELIKLLRLDKYSDYDIANILHLSHFDIKYKISILEKSLNSKYFGSNYDKVKILYIENPKIKVSAASKLLELDRATILKYKKEIAILERPVYKGAKEIIRVYFKDNPGASKTDAAIDLKVSRTTIHKHVKGMGVVSSKDVIIKLYKLGIYSKSEIARMAGVSRTTVHKHLKKKKG